MGYTVVKVKNSQSQIEGARLMGLSDVIAQFIHSALAAEGEALLSRSELSERFNCVPSQINYVLTTRFSPEHGFLIESRRGGGGYIRVTRVSADRAALIMHAINACGDAIDEQSAAAFLYNLTAAGVLGQSNAALIAAAVSDNALRPLSRSLRGSARAGILKNCLLHISITER